MKMRLYVFFACLYVGLCSREPPWADAKVMYEATKSIVDKGSLQLTLEAPDFFFIIRDGKIVTPPLGASVLPGITRGCIIQLARELDISITEGLIPRELLYIADEVFFTGTAAEVTPIRSVDKVVVGEGKAGPITRKIQSAFFDLIEGRREDSLGLHYWL